ADRGVVPEWYVHHCQSTGGCLVRLSQSPNSVQCMTLSKSVLAIRHTWQVRGLPPLLPLLIVGLLVFCALFAPLLAPHSPIEGSRGTRLTPPLGLEGSSAEHVLGTDRLGRDTLSRLIYGAQISLAVSLVGILLTGVVGAAIGLLAGFWGAW